MSAPRVLLSGLALAQPMGGVVRHARELLPRAGRVLAARGGALAVLEGRGGLPLELPPEVERVRCSLPAGSALVRASLETAQVRRVLATARERGRAFALVHTAHLPAPGDLEVPYTLLLHDLKALRSRQEPVTRRIVAQGVVLRGVRRAALVLTVSEALRSEVLELSGLPHTRVRVVPNAADHLVPLAREPAPDAPLVHVGHIEPRKNLALLLRALAHDPTLPRLVLAGAPKGDEDVRLRDLAARLGVSRRVEFVGLLDDAGLTRLYARAACAVFPSLREGFGIPALEARLCGVPVAVSRSAALLEVAGLETPSFESDDPAGCAAAVRAALATPRDELDRAAEHARRYRWDDSAALLVDAWTVAAGATSASKDRRTDSGPTGPGTRTSSPSQR